MKTHFTLRSMFAFMMIALSMSSFAISPDQVGTYTGTVTAKRHDLDAEKPVSLKLPITLTLQSDDSYTVNFMGESLSGPKASIGTYHGSINHTTGGFLLNVTLHFKGDQARGVLQYLPERGLELTEGKVTLRKDPL